MTVEDRWTAVAIVGAVFVFLVGGATAYLGLKEHVVTRTVRVEKDYGRPDQTIPAVQIAENIAANGAAVCDWYASRKTLVCHP